MRKKTLAKMRKSGGEGAPAVEAPRRREGAPVGRPASGWGLQEAYKGPGHLARRFQQIAVGIFLEEFRHLDISPVQHIALVAIRDNPGLEQQAIAELIAIDRSSAGRVMGFLEKRGLIKRIMPKDNKRKKVAFVTTAGERLIGTTGRLIKRAEDRILRVLNDKEKRDFMALLEKIVDINNTYSRAPLRLIVPSELEERSA